MKKNLGFLLILVLNYLGSFAQGWPHSYPQWNGLVQESLFESYDKGYAFLLWPFTNNRTIFVKTDINGNQLWYKVLGDQNYYFRMGCMDRTPDGGFVICTGFDKYDPIGSADPVVIKFNACGEIDWCSTINTPGIFDFSDRIRRTNNGEYVLLTSYSDPLDSNRIQLYKLNSQGNLIWKRNYPGDGYVFNEDGNDVLALNDGYLIAGTGYAPDSGQIGWGAERPYFIKTDTSGNIEWRLVYGINDNFTGRTAYSSSTIQSTSGNFYYMGRNSTYCDTPSLLKVLQDGTESYHQDIMPDACPGGSSAMSLLDDTTFVVYGGGTVNGSYLGKWMKIDTLGLEKYSKVFVEDWMMHSGYNVVTFDNKIICISDYNLQLKLYKLNEQFDFDSIYLRPFTYDSLCPHPIVSDTIDPDCGLIVSVPDIKKNPEAFRLKVYPNPAKSEISVELPQTLMVGDYDQMQYFQWDKTFLEIYDLQGVRIFNQEISFSQHSIIFDISKWTRGMYFLKLNFKGNTVSAQKLIIQ